MGSQRTPQESPTIAHLNTEAKGGQTYQWKLNQQEYYITRNPPIKHCCCCQRTTHQRPQISNKHMSAIKTWYGSKTAPPMCSQNGFICFSLTIMFKKNEHLSYYLLEQCSKPTNIFLRLFVFRTGL